MLIIYVAFIIVVTSPTIVEGLDCGTTLGTIATNNADATMTTGQGYLMKSPVLDITCCGIIEEWRFNLQGVTGASQDLQLQVWESVAGGTQHQLVGQNSYTATLNGDNTYPVDQADRITVRNPSYFGWWTSGPPIVTYFSAGTSGNDNNKRQQYGALSVGNTIDWNSVDVNARSYAVEVVLGPSNPPQFTNLAVTVQDSINVAPATSLYTVAFTDIDVYDIPGLTVSMVPSTNFSFDTSTYIVSTAQSFSGASFTEELVFNAVDDCDKTGSATLTVFILNQPPTIHDVPFSVNISETAVEIDTLLIINATDPDGLFRCYLGASNPAGAPFTVRLKAGTSKYELINEYDPSFNAAITSQYELTVVCDDGQYTDSGTVYVYVERNKAPFFVNLQNSTVISTTDGIGTTVFTAICSDPEGDDLQYSMTCVPPTCDFEIFHSGEIRTNAVLTSAVVGYDLYITCSDNRTTTGPSILTVTFADLNDPVTWANLPNNAVIPENVAVGSFVFATSFTDVDTGQAHSFYWTSTSTEGLSLFSIDPNNGTIYTSNPLDYETITATSFSFDVTVADPVVTDTQTLVIDVTNVNEAPSFSQTSYSLSTNEGQANDVIGSPPFGITDPENDATTVTMDCGTETAYFTLNAGLDVLFQSDYDLDATSLPSLVTCTLNVTDPGGLSDTATLYISIANINDNVPDFSPASYFFHLSYYATAGTTIGTLTATDADIGTYGVLTYTLDQSSLSVPHFALDNAGLLTVRNTPFGSVMGYDTTVTLNAIVTDSGGQNDTAVVTITISDTTTTSTTTTTTYYLTFFDDKRNVAWFTFCMVLLFGVGVTLLYIIFTCNGTYGCWNLLRGPRRRFDFKERPEDFGEMKSVNMVSARNCPPPVQYQSWRNGWTAH